MTQDSKLCPFCQQTNECDVSNQQACWCFQAQVPKALLALLPEQRDKSCICFACIQSFKADDSLFAQQFQAQSKSSF